MKRARILGAALALIATTALAGCGAADEQSGAQSPQSAQSGQSEPPADQSGQSQDQVESKEKPPTVDRDPKGKLPKFELGEGDEAPTMDPVDASPPKEISVKTLKKGEGKVVGPDDFVTVNYIGFLWDGTEFDSSYSRGEPATFSLNAVIKGWKWGLAETRVGDTVALMIPPQYGYGSAGTGSIPPNATLVFVVSVVDTVSVNPKVLSEATPTEDKLPAGLAITGDLGSEPTLEFASGAASPKDAETIVVAKGKGRTITDDDTVAYHLVGAPWGAESQTSTWDEGVQSTEASGTVLAGQNVGSRVLLIEPATGAGTAPHVVLIDIVGAVGSDGK